MNAPRFPSPASDEEASLWAARMGAGPLSSADQSALEAWLAADQDHLSLLETYRDLSAALDEQLPVLAEVGAIEPAAEPVRSRDRSRFRSRTWLTVAGLGAAAAVAFAVWLPSLGSETRFATTAGERRTVDLADGSRVELNAHTTLRVVQSGKERRAELTGGEAFFVVAKDAARPFLVETPLGTVRVTGTVFDVRDQDPAQLDVTVVEGSVQVRLLQDGSTYLLHAGDRLSADHPGIEKLSAGAIDDLLAWRDGEVVFDRTPLREAMAQYARYTGRAVDVAPAVAGLRIGGRYSLDSRFLEALETTLPVQVDRDAGGTVHVQPRSQR